MEKEITVARDKIQELKIESNKWRSVKGDLLEFRKKQLEEKEKEFSTLKESLINCFSNDYYSRSKEPGYLDILIDCYDALLEKSNEEINSIYNKYSELVIKKLGSSNNSRFSNLIKLRNPIHKLKKLIKEEEKNYKKEVISKKEVDDFLSKLDKRIQELESSLTAEKKANYILNNRLIEKDQLIENLNNKLDLRDLSEINLSELLELEKDQLIERLKNNLSEKEKLIIEYERKLSECEEELTEFKEIEKANERLNQSIRGINFYRLETDSTTTNSESNYSLVEEQFEDNSSPGFTLFQQDI